MPVFSHFYIPICKNHFRKKKLCKKKKTLLKRKNKHQVFCNKMDKILEKYLRIVTLFRSIFSYFLIFAKAKICKNLATVVTINEHVKAFYLI